jgi:chaperonin GroEL
VDSTAVRRYLPRVTYLSPLGYLLGLEGVALLRGFRDGRANRAFVEARIAEIRALLDTPVLAQTEGVTATPGGISTAEVYRSWASHYDAPGNQLIDIEQPVVQRILDVLPVGTALDAACGTGRHTAYLDARGHRVIGCDTSPEMLAHARKGLPQAGLLQADLHRLPLPEQDYARVAAISANDDTAVGEVIAKALHTVGDNGIVTVEESATHGMSVDFVEGFEFDNGYLSPYMVTNPATLEAIVDDPYILLCSEKITKVQQLMPLLDKIMRAPRPLVILAETVEGTALSMLVHNHANGIFQCVAVRAPGFGDRRLHKLEDIATITGGSVYSRHSGFTLETMTTEHLGRAAQVRITPERTAIIGGRGEPGEVEFRIDQLRAELERTTFGIDEDVLTERIGSLSGKVGVIRVGAPTNAELNELQHRVEDALSATRAAMAEGIVAGGGAALMHAEDALDDLEVKDDYATGVEIVRRVLTEPAYLIAANAGYSGDEVVSRMSQMAADEGFDALEGRYGDMIEMGIIDPLRVARCALQNGASVAGLLLTTNTLIAEEQTPWGGSPALMTEYGALDEGLQQPSPDSSTPQSLGLGPSIG